MDSLSREWIETVREIETEGDSLLSKNFSKFYKKDFEMDFLKFQK